MAMAYDDKTLAGLESQVDDLVKQIDDVLKLGGGDTGARRGPKADDADVKGSGKENLSGWKRKESKHDFQVKKGEEGDEDDAEAALAKAAETLGVDPEFLAEALTKASMASQDDGDDDGDDEDDDEPSNPGKKTHKAAPDGDGDDSVVIEGERISKADVGEAVFNVLKSQSDKIEAQRLDIAKAQDEAQMAVLSKRADSEFAHVPGTSNEKAQMLKAIGTMPEALRKHFERVLTQSEKIAKAAFATVGVAGSNPEDFAKSKRDFEAKVAEIAKRDGLPRHEAMSKARQEDPEGFKAYQGNGN